MLNDVKVRLMRSFLRLPEDVHSKDYTVKCVSNLEEFKEALTLLHDCYVQKGLMQPHSSRMRVMPHHLLPETNIMIVQHKGKVIATGTIVHRGLIKLPSYSAFSDQFSFYTNNEIDSHEFSALAVHPDYRKKKNTMQFLLTKYYFQLLNTIYKRPYLLCAVHPKARIFYKVLFNLESEKNVVDHFSVEGAPAVFVKGSIDEKTIGSLAPHFHGTTSKENFIVFFLEKDDRFIFPNISKAILFDPMYYYKLTQEIYPYLLQNAILTIDQYKKIVAQVCHFMPFEKNINYFNTNRAYRSRSSLTILDKDNHEVGRVDNMSLNGMLIRLNPEVKLFSPNGVLELHADWNGKKVDFESKIIRLDMSSQQAGLGLQLLGENQLILDLATQVKDELKTNKAA